MATLYTPSPQREGLDWLSGLVRSGQSLWQNERQLQQAAKRLALAKQQQEIQMQQFWSEQERLKRQEDFQNRKFMYAVGQDERDRQRQTILDDRSHQATLRDDLRLATTAAYEMNPENPRNKYMVSQTAENEASVALKEQEFEANQAPPFADIGELTSKNDRGIDKMFSRDASGDPAGDGTPTGQMLLPDINDIPPGKAVRTGDPNNPVIGRDPVGNPYMWQAAYANKQGRPNSYMVKSLVPKGKASKDALDEEINMLTDNLNAARGRLRNKPAFPSGDEPNPAAVAAFEAQSTEIEADNAPVREQINQISVRLNDANARKRMISTDLKLEKVTPEFEQRFGATFFKALQDRAPSVLRMMRPQIAALADSGDPSAKQAVEYIDNVIGVKEAAKPKKTGYY